MRRARAAKRGSLPLRFTVAERTAFVAELFASSDYRAALGAEAGARGARGVAVALPQSGNAYTAVRQVEVAIVDLSRDLLLRLRHHVSPLFTPGQGTDAR